MIIITRSALDCQSVQQNNTQFVIFNCSLAKSDIVQICFNEHLSTFTLPCSSAGGPVLVLGGGAGEARPGERDGGGGNLGQITAATTAFHCRFFSQRKAVTAAFFALLYLNGKR